MAAMEGCSSSRSSSADRRSAYRARSAGSSSRPKPSDRMAGSWLVVTASTTAPVQRPPERDGRQACDVAPGLLIRDRLLQRADDPHQPGGEQSQDADSAERGGQPDEFG